MRRQNTVRHWRPWYEVGRVTGAMRGLNGRSHGLLLLIGLLVTTTVAGALAVSQLALFVSVVGGLLIVVVITTATRQWCELRDGLQAIGGSPPMLDMARTMWLLCLADVKRLAQGGAHDEHQTGSGPDTSAS